MASKEPTKLVVGDAGGKMWSEKDAGEKAMTLVNTVYKTILLTTFLYFFIISLSLMGHALRVLGGKTSGRAFRDSELFDNPFAGLVTGILVTVIVQSSSTSTGIVIAMASGDLISIKNAVPMVMGANIGTSVTNTLVSLRSVGDRNEYRRAFAGATVHDMFNLLCVLVFLPLQVVTGFLQHAATSLTDSMGVTDDEMLGAKTDILKALVKPVSNRMLAINGLLMSQIAAEQDPAKLAVLEKKSMLQHANWQKNHMFMDTPMSDEEAGVMITLVSLLFLALCLILMVKVLQTIFKGRIAMLTRQLINMELPVPGLANYVLIGFGCGLTMVFQSSSVTTSTLTPLVGLGLVKLEKMFPFTVGANMGTTITGVLVAMVQIKRKTSLTVAFCHMLFNVFGFLFWYPIPVVRQIPINMAYWNGNMAADLKWWPTAYIAVVFGGIPAFLLGLSVVSPWALLAVGVPFMIALLVLIVVIYLRANKSAKLPASLQRDPAWLPMTLKFDRVVEDFDTGLSDNPQEQLNQAAEEDDGSWQAAPFAWGPGWYILMALLVGITNAKWADVKYAGFDGRDHMGFSAWQACSYSFQNQDMPWALPYDPAQCTSADLQACAALPNCATVSFSDKYGANFIYEKSWKACKAKCPMFKWTQWCGKQVCGGTLHKKQCSNVTKAVQHGSYVVKYGPAGGFAWRKGARCRPFSDICQNGDQLKRSGDVGAIAFVLSVGGQILVLAHCFLQNKNPARARTLLLGGGVVWFLAWIFAFASWGSYMTFAGLSNTCIMADSSGTGAVLATMPFKKLAHTSYTFGCIVGSWCFMNFILFAIFTRLAQGARKAPVVEAAPAPVEPEPAPVKEPEPVPVKEPEPAPVEPEPAPVEPPIATDEI